MKKLIIIFIGAFTLLFGINVKVSAFYTLETPIAELNNHTLSEVFENRNMAMPDLTGATDLGDGIYQIRSTYGVTLTYNINNGIWTLNGTTTGIATNAGIIMQINSEIGTFSATYIRVGGTNTSNDSQVHIRLSNVPIGVNIGLNQDNQVINGYQNNRLIVLYIRLVNGETFDNLQFKLQIEKGTTATPYQVSTNGPYSEIDISTLDLTVEQMDYWFNVYQEVLNDIERVNNLPSLFNDIFGELTNNFVIGFRGFTELIYLDGYGLTDLGIILLIVSSISIIGFAFYIVRKVIK